MKGTPELLIGTMQFTFLVKDKGVEDFMLPEFR